MDPIKSEESLPTPTDNKSTGTDPSTSSWISGGWMDYIYTNTSQFANMLQWGEQSEPYSLSKDSEMVSKMRELMQKKIKKQGSQSHTMVHHTPENEIASEGCAFVPSSKVVDMTFYNRLNVEHTATKSQIKASYYRLALKYHPDKNPNDEEAKVKFQEIGEAYQVLSDDAMRAKYDKHGTMVTQDMPMIDHSLFFMLLFGCEQLEEYIGTLKIAFLFQYASMEDNGKRLNLNSQMDIDQRLREVNLALILRDKLEDVISKGKWPDNFQSGIEELCEGTFGDTLVESIGWVYENCAEAFIAEMTTFWGLGATYANIQAAGRSINNTWSMAKSVVNVALVIKDLKSYKDNAVDQQDTMEKLKEIITNALSLVLYDVENTVRAAATKVCKDEDVEIARRLERAKNLKELGMMMQEAAKRSRASKGDQAPDVSRQMYDAFVKATQKSD